MGIRDLDHLRGKWVEHRLTGKRGLVTSTDMWGYRKVLWENGDRTETSDAELRISANQADKTQNP